MACAALGQSAAPPPDDRRLFQPGVWIDWRVPAVHVQAKVVLRQGPLEFLACWPGKEHESILRLEASAIDVWMALGLIGLTPGHPPILDPDTGVYGPPAGDLVDVLLEWELDGCRYTVDAYTWLRDVELAGPRPARPWVYAGSLPRADGRLMCEHTGAGFALVDFPESFFALSRRFPSRYGSLWAEAHTPVIPPVTTPVRLLLRPARPRVRHVVLGEQGEVYVDGRRSTLADVADLIDLDRRLRPDRVQTIHVHGALYADVLRLRWHVATSGTPPSAVRFRTAAWPPWRRSSTWPPGRRPPGDRATASGAAA